MNGWAHTITDTVRHVSCSDCCCTTPTPDPASPCGVCNQGTVMCFYKAAAAEARAGMVSVEALAEAIHRGCERRWDEMGRLDPDLAITMHYADAHLRFAAAIVEDLAALAATPPAPAVERCGYLIRMLGLTPFICNRAEDDALHRSRTHPDAHSFLGLIFRADGQPGQRCAGWARANREWSAA